MHQCELRWTRLHLITGKVGDIGNKETVAFERCTGNAAHGEPEVSIFEGGVGNGDLVFRLVGIVGVGDEEFVEIFDRSRVDFFVEADVDGGKAGELLPYDEGGLGIGDEPGLKVKIGFHFPGERGDVFEVGELVALSG